MVGDVSIRNLTRHVSVPRFAYATIAETVLPGWDCSLAFVGQKRARTLNALFRGKMYTPNVLSYVVGKKSGEIIICLEEAAKQAPAYGMPARKFVLYLFIHGLLHLKGEAHSATMERCERVLLARFAENVARPHTHAPTYRHRN